MKEVQTEKEREMKVRAKAILYKKLRRKKKETEKVEKKFIVWKMSTCWLTSYNWRLFSDVNRMEVNFNWIMTANNECLQKKMIANDVCLQNNDN